MARGTVNKVIIIGRLGKDPDMRYAPSGTAIASFTMATNHSTKDADGNWNQQTEWHSIKTFGRQAEFVGEYFKKGKLAYVEGRLQTSSWEDQNGQKKYRTDIIANDVQMLGSRSEGEQQQSHPEVPAESAAKPASKPAEPEPASPDEDDLPF